MNYKIIASVVACTLMLGASEYFSYVSSEAKKNAQDEVVLAWVADAFKQHCAVSSFLYNDGKEPRVVWTCPDGLAMLQPERLRQQ